MGKLVKSQPFLFNNIVTKDIVFTPEWLSQKIITHFNPSGLCLDPCRGDGSFFNNLPAGSEWCEISDGKDFFSWNKKVDWIISNPPYSNLLSWIRHSFLVSENIVYLIPLHRVFASYKFISDLNKWGGVKEIVIVGTGTTASFPFGHCLGAFYIARAYKGETKWTVY